MEQFMIPETTQILLFLAIVALTVVSAIDLMMQPIRPGKDTDRKG
jgi:hypothetical protein